MTDGYSTTTRISTGQVYRLRHLPLLDQLVEAVSQSGGVGADGHRIPESQPPARLDALDRYRAIEGAVAVRLAQGGVRLAGDLKADMRRLVGVAWDDSEMDAVDKDVRRWLSWCRVLTGWETPAFAPNAKCPACGMRGTLRVRLDRRTACCVEPGCDAVWDPETIDALAEYVRLSTSGYLAAA